MGVVAVQQVTKQMEDGEFLTAIKTVVWVINPKLHIGFHHPSLETFSILAELNLLNADCHVQSVEYHQSRRE
jgi:hypothetical protein